MAQIWMVWHFVSRTLNFRVYLVTQMRSEIKEKSIEDNIIISEIKLKGVSEEEIEKNDIKQVEKLLSVLNLSRDKVETHSFA
jgi:hypothetical protein